MSVFICGIRDLAPNYDVLLCDIWGVIHDGIRAFPEAGEALTRFRTGGGIVILVSNAPRPGANVIAQLDALRVARSSYDGIVTSGDLSRDAISARAGQKVHHLGPERDLPLFEGLDAVFSSLEEADYVVCTGLFDDESEGIDDYRETLALMRRRGLLMICANPDLVVERGRQLILCAGALAAAYEEQGGEVFYAGKPHRPVYDAALAKASEVLGRSVDPRRVLAIGDAIRTDIAGAAEYGLASLMIARGIHAKEFGGNVLDEAKGSDWLSRQTARPDRVMPILKWK